jgi:hypothetical protein
MNKPTIFLKVAGILGMCIGVTREIVELENGNFSLFYLLLIILGILTYINGEVK